MVEIKIKITKDISVRRHIRLKLADTRKFEGDDVVVTVSDVIEFSECGGGEFVLQFEVMPMGEFELCGYFYFYAGLLLGVKLLGVVAVCLLLKLL